MDSRIGASVWDNKWEYLVAAGYFARPPADVPGTLRACCNISRRITGDLWVRAELFGARSERWVNPRFKGRLSDDIGISETAGLTEPSFRAVSLSGRDDVNPRHTLWRISFSSGGRTFPPHLTLAFCLTKLSSDQIIALSAAVNDLMDVLMGTGCCDYALADVGDVFDTAFGITYESTDCNVIRPERRILGLAWLESGGGAWRQGARRVLG